MSKYKRKDIVSKTKKDEDYQMDDKEVQLTQKQQLELELKQEDERIKT